MDPKPSDLLIHESSSDALLYRAPGGSLELVESATDATSAFNSDGTVNVVLLRPGMGRGPAGVGNAPGRRIYTRDMLESNADVFTGWASYMNHDSPGAKRARAGLPRPPTELAGQIVESTWDGEFSTPRDQQMGFGRGAVIGRYMPATDECEQLIRRIPSSLKFSVNGTATAMRPGTSDSGDAGLLVEGIVNDPENSSFDMVTKAGAGGEVKALIESLADPDGPTAPEVPYASGNAADDDNPGGDDVGKLTLIEALQTPEVSEHFKSLVESAVDEKVTELKPQLEQQTRDEVRQEFAGELEGARVIRRASRSKELIEAAPLRPAQKADLLEGYGYTDDGDKIIPGSRLALIEAEVDGDGATVKSAMQVLEAAIEADVKRERNKLSEAAPTVPSSPPSGGAAGDGSGISFGGPGSAWADRARQSGMNTDRMGAASAAPAKS